MVVCEGGVSDSSRVGHGPASKRSGAAEELDMGEVHHLVTNESGFGVQAAGRLITTVFRSWVHDLALLVESVEAVRPADALPDWQPGAVVRLPFSKSICANGEAVCSQALMALADSAMVIACSAAWERYRATI